MAFNIKSFARFTYKSLFESRGTNYRLTPKRIKWLAILYLGYPLLELTTWTGFLLDEILHPDYRREEITEPVFIVGTPRSGTTFLQRLLTKDAANFSSMKTWEILFAPSITARRIVRALTRLDKLLGSPLGSALASLERRWQKQNVMHKVALRASEEDDYLLIHIWSSLKIWLFAGMLDEAMPYAYFDSAVPDKEKSRILSFYKSCVQRHLYLDGCAHNVYLSKNPHFTPMIDTLLTHFPDARFIYLARNPLDMIPSLISLKAYEWSLFGDPLEEYACRDYVLNVASHWYTYPLERLKHACQGQHIVIDFDSLVSNPEQAVRTIYTHFGLDVTAEFADVLERETEEARNYESQHEYSLEDMGLTREQIVSQYAAVFAEFGFDTREDESPTEESLSTDASR